MLYLRNILALIVLVALVLAGCAKIAKPPGGPIDKRPPKVVETYPNDLDINVPLDSIIVIRFDERIKPEPKAIRIFPKPKGMKVKFKRKSILIYHSGLKANTTYIVHIVPDLSDLHGNKIGRTITFAFSTGEMIEKGIIKGFVFDEKLNPVSGALVYALSDSLSTIMFTVSGTHGEFKIGYLPRDSVIIVAKVIGKDSALVSFGAIGPVVPDLEGIAVVIARFDTTPPSIRGVDLTDHYTFALRFSEYLDLKAFSLVANGIKPSDLWTITDSSVVFARFDSLPQKFMISAKFCDKFGNCDSLSREVIDTMPPDTVPPRIISPKKKTVGIVEPDFAIVFDEPTVMKISGLPGSVRAEKISPNAICFIFSPDMRVGERFILHLDSLCDDYGNCTSDSVEFVYAQRLFGEIRVKCPSDTYKRLIFAKNIENERIYRLNRGVDGSFSGVVVKGRYILIRFRDEDSNGRLTAGKYRPFVLGEFTEVFDDTISVRAGWTTEVSW